jgi:Putative transposase, YhgA-like
VDRFMAVRLAGYVSLLYQELIARGELSPDERLPLVIPIVLYNGTPGWSAPTDLAELIDAVEPELAPYLPRLRYKVIDEGSYTPEELRQRHSLPALLFWLERNRNQPWDDSSRSSLQVGVEPQRGASAYQPSGRPAHPPLLQ